MDWWNKVTSFLSEIKGTIFKVLSCCAVLNWRSSIYTFQTLFSVETPTLWKKSSHEAECDLHNFTSKPRLIMPVQILKGPHFWQLENIFFRIFLFVWYLDQLTIWVDLKLFIPNLVYFQINQCVHKRENVDQIKTWKKHLLWIETWTNQGCQPRQPG